MRKQNNFGELARAGPASLLLPLNDIDKALHGLLKGSGDDYSPEEHTDTHTHHHLNNELAKKCTKAPLSTHKFSNLPDVYGTYFNNV